MAMKRNFKLRLVSILLILATMLGFCLPASAFSVSAPSDDVADDELFYSVAYENGEWTIRVNPDKIYGILKDRNLTREELLNFIPQDVLDTLSQGRELSVSDLISLAAQYVSIDELKAMVRDMPIDLVRKYFSVDMLLDLFTVQEILDVFDFDGLFSGVTGEALSELLTDDALKLLLNEKVKSKIMTEDFVKELFETTPLFDDILKDPTMRAELIALFDEASVKSMMDDPAINKAIHDLASTTTVTDRLFADDEAVAGLQAYFTADEQHDERMELFDDEEVVTVLANSSYIRDYILSHGTIEKLIRSGALTSGEVRAVLGDDNLYSILTPELMAALGEDMSDDGFLKKIADDDAVVDLMLPAYKTALYQSGIVTTLDAPDDYYLDLIDDPSDTRAKTVFLNLFRNKTVISLDAFWSYVDLAAVVHALDTNVIIHLLDNNSEIYDDLRNAVTAHELLDAIGDDGVDEIFANDLAEIVHEVGVNKLIQHHFVLDDMVAAAGGYHNALSKEFIKLDELTDELGGIGPLVHYIPDLDAIIEIVGAEKLLRYVDLTKIVAKLGGYDNLLRDYYTPAELKALAKTIGPDRFKAFLKASHILENLNLRQKAIDLIDLARSKVGAVKSLLATIGERTAALLLQDIESITLNGVAIYDIGSFHLADIYTQLLVSIPDVDTMLSLQPNDLFAKLGLVITDKDGNTYGSGINLGLLGDPSNLQELIEKHRDKFEYNISDNGDITTSLHLPDGFTALYVKLLESERLPARLHLKLLEAPNMSMSDLGDCILSITDEEKQAVSDIVREKVDEIKQKAYAAIEARFGTPAPQARGIKDTAADKATEAINRAKARADELINDFTSPETITKVLNKAAAAAYKTGELTKNRTALELYQGEGNFFANGTATVDILDKINQFVELPDAIYLLFDQSSISQTVTTKFSSDGIRRYTFVKTDGTQITTLLPMGVSIKALIPLLGEGAWMDSWANGLSGLPGMDATLYSAEFYHVDFMIGGELYKTVIYEKSETSIEIPEIPEDVYLYGHTAVWESFVLGSAPEITVNQIFDPNDYKVYFYADKDFDGTPDLIDTIPFTFGDAALSRDPFVPTVKGYDFQGFTGAYNPALAEDQHIYGSYTPGEFFVYFYDYDGTLMPQHTIAYRYGETPNEQVPSPRASDTYFTYVWDKAVDWTLAEDQDIHMVRDEKTFKITFYAEDRTTVVGERTYTYSQQSFDVPAVPAKTGFTGAWEEYASRLFTAAQISVYPTYTRNQYTVTFVADTDLDGTDDWTRTVDFTFGLAIDASLLPTAPTINGYTFKSWSPAYDVNKAENQTVRATYDRIKYTIVFANENNVEVKSFDYYINEYSHVVAPSVPSKPGYTGAWGSYELFSATLITVKPVYTINTYTATFIVKDGTSEWKKEVHFTVADTAITPPTDAPAKTGYKLSWSDYTIRPANFEVYGTYTPIVYTATFVADGDVVATVPFTVESKSITEPPVPEKKGYKGHWEEYTLGAADLTINAVYEKVASDTTSDGSSDTTAADKTKEEKKFSWWWILVIVLVLAIGALIFFLVWQKKNNDDDNTPPTPPVEPVAEPEPEPAPEAEAEPVPAPAPKPVHKPKAPVKLAAAGAVATITMGALMTSFEAGETVTLEILKERKLAPAKAKRLKVIFSDTAVKPLNIVAHSVSPQAVDAITKAGGTVTIAKQ